MTRKDTIAREYALRAMLDAMARMVADIREQETFGLCTRMRITQIIDLERAIALGKRAIKGEPS